MQKKAFSIVLLAIALLISVNIASAQSGVRAVVVNEFANVRVVPAIGATVRGTVPSGWIFEVITARSPDNEWLRVDFNGDEGWVNVATLTILAGDVGALPVADPRTIPYGGFESPRAGLSSASSAISAQLTSGLRVRAGPSTGYPVLANAPFNSVVPLLGRTASSGWVQINFEGTLGWIATRYIEVQNGANLASLPVDGVVAESLPISQPVEEDYIATLRFLLDRINLAQPSLDSIRASWADSALTGRASCQPYPARPSDYNIPNQLLAAFYVQLDPIQTLFNDAMANIRRSIDLFIEVCNQPGTVNPVGQATVIGALDVVALADSQFTELRRRIAELIPPDRELADDECLFAFGGGVDILKIISVGQLASDSFTPQKTATGFCFDAAQGQNLIVEVYQRTGGNINFILSVSPFDNPTNFLATGSSASTTQLFSVGPLLVPQTGRYLLVLSNFQQPEEPLSGEFVVLISVIQPGSVLTNFLIIDPVTGQPIVASPSNPIAPGTGSGLPVITVTPPNQGLGFDSSNPAPDRNAVCPSTGLSCEQLSSCDEAYACLNAGNFNLDPDNDGIPCEVVRCPAN
ncbi:MAG: SH3 domain-containing protein [Aggregatilineales bacterium]